MDSLINVSDWHAFLGREEARLGFSDGFEFLYCPVATISSAKVAFISLNPGRAPDNAELREVSDEAGNSFEREKTYTRSPLTDQFLQFCEFMVKNPKRF